jgi:hypothetical protein
MKVSDIHKLLADAATSHRDSVSVLVQFVQKTHALLQQRPALRDPTEAGRYLRPSPVLLSTMQPEEITKLQESVEELIQQERERQEQIVSAAQEFPGLLMRMSLIYRVALFDAFISDVQFCVLSDRPELLKNKDRKMSYAQIVDALLQQRLIDVMTEVTVSGIERHPFDEQFRKIAGCLQIDGAKMEETTLKSVTELMARRNIFTHANGIVNSAYRSLVPDSAFPIGTKLDVSYEYWMKGDQLLRAVCDQLLRSIFVRYCQGVSAPTI